MPVSLNYYLRPERSETSGGGSTRGGIIDQVMKLGQVVPVVLGVVVEEVGKRRRTARGDWMVTFRLGDVSSPKGVTVNCFRKEEKGVPELRKGDLIRLEKVKAQLFNSQPQLLFLYQSTITIYRTYEPSEVDNSNLTVKLPDSFHQLYHWWQQLNPKPIPAPIQLQSPPPSLPPPPTSTVKTRVVPIEVNKKLRRYSEVIPGKEFFDIAIEVIHLYPRKNSYCIELLATDYTTNSLSTSCNDSQLPIPEELIGKGLVFRITLWDEHSRSPTLNHASRGTMLFLKNCVGKPSPLQKLEVVLHGTRGVPENKVFPLKSPLLEQLIERKKSFQSELIKSNVNLRETSPNQETNSLTKILYPNAPVTKLNDIIIQPQAPYIYRTYARITGFLPDLNRHPLASFCKPLCPTCQSICPSLELTCPQCPPPPPEVPLTWTYQFCLLVKDPDQMDSPPLPVMVTGPSAQQFLPHLPATDLTRHPLTSSHLKLTLRHLLTHPTPLPLCLQSYLPTTTNSSSPITTTTNSPTTTTICYQLFATTTTIIPPL